MEPSCFLGFVGILDPIFGVASSIFQILLRFLVISDDRLCAGILIFPRFCGHFRSDFLGWQLIYS